MKENVLRSKRMAKKPLLAMLLSFVMMFSLVPTVFAAGETYDIVAQSQYSGETNVEQTITIGLDIANSPNVNARVGVSVSGPGTLQMVFTDTENNDYDVADVGVFGPPEGFAVAGNYNMTTDFRVIADTAGTYTIDLTLSNAGDDSVLANKTITYTVADPVTPTYEITANASYTGMTGTEKAVDVGLALTNSPAVQASITVAVAGPTGGTLQMVFTDAGVDHDVAALGFFGPVTGFPVSGNYSMTTPFRVTADKAGTYTITLKLVDKANSDAVLATKVITYTVANPVTPTYEITADASYTGTTNAQKAVDVGLNITNSLAIKASVVVAVAGPVGGTLQMVFTDTANNDYDVAALGFFGPPTGFPVNGNYSMTTPFRVTADKAGTYTIVLNLIDKDDNDAVLATKVITYTVANPVTPTYAITADASYTGTTNAQKAVDVGLNITNSPAIKASITVGVASPAGGTLQMVFTDTANNDYDVAALGFFGPVAGFPVNGNYTMTTPFRVTANKAGTYTITLKLVDKDNNNTVLATKVITYTVSDSVTPPVTQPSYAIVAENSYTGTTNMQKTVQVGLAIETSPAINAGVNVSVAGPGTLKMVFTDTANNDYDVAALGFFGPATGFPVNGNYSMTTPFRVTADKAGTYTITLTLIDKATNKVLVTKVITYTVSDPTPEPTPTPTPDSRPSSGGGIAVWVDSNASSTPSPAPTPITTPGTGTTIGGGTTTGSGDNGNNATEAITGDIIPEGQPNPGSGTGNTGNVTVGGNNATSNNAGSKANPATGEYTSSMMIAIGGVALLTFVATILISNKKRAVQK